MKIALFSNYLSPHQTAFSEELLKVTNGEFRFIACERFDHERKSFGYSDINSLDFVIRAYEDEEQLAEAKRWCMESDIIICGSCWRKFIDMRRKSGRPFFKYSERLYKVKVDYHKLPLRTVKHFIKNRPSKNEYMLCASAFAASDYAKTLEYRGKCYKWGYFTEQEEYENVDELIDKKRKNSILWAGRFIAFKHPEVAVEIAERLKGDGYEFEMNLIGSGILAEKIKELIEARGLADSVHMLGSMSPESVRQRMEESEIFLFTSDRNEGWGAVLNESMNSSCAVVASHAIGAVPFLINDRENGFIYKDGDIDSLYKKVKYLLDNSDKRKQLSKAAYQTITTEWNAANAAEKFMHICEGVLAGKKKFFPFEDGVCSKAKKLKDGWYK